MEAKLVRVSGDVHRRLAIQAATRGETIQSITDRAVRQEIARMEKVEKKKIAGVKVKKVSVKV
jgi:predicted transcriptional regulator